MFLPFPQPDFQFSAATSATLCIYIPLCIPYPWKYTTPGNIGKPPGCFGVSSQKYGGDILKSVPIWGGFSAKSLIFSVFKWNMPKITGLYIGFTVPISKINA